MNNRNVDIRSLFGSRTLQPARGLEKSNEDITEEDITTETQRIKTSTVPSSRPSSLLPHRCRQDGDAPWSLTLPAPPTESSPSDPDP